MFAILADAMRCFQVDFDACQTAKQREFREARFWVFTDEVYETNQNRFAIILAGGDGTRLSEVTRRISGLATPKQFCPVIGNTSLLEQTRLRVALAVDKNRIF